jgi:hypothetical protein
MKGDAMRISLNEVVVLAALCLSGVPAVQAAEKSPALATPEIAIYQSEANAVEYKGVHQSPLRAWLTDRQLRFHVLGDRDASDSGVLSKYSLVIATSCYIVPDTVCAALAEYVASGGDLLWIDGPARCRHKGLLTTLGIEPGCTYATTSHAVFRLLVPGHFLCSGATDFTSSAAGNPAVKALGKVVAAWSPKVGQPLPAIVVSRTGKGRAVLVNWIPWLNMNPQTQTLLANAVDYLMAQRLLRSGRCLLPALVGSAEVVQPAPIALRVRVLGGSEEAARTATLGVSVVDAQGEVQGRAENISAAMRFAEGEGLAHADIPFSLPTQGLPDGVYRFRVSGRIGNAPARIAEVAVTLGGQARARLMAAEAERAKLLRPLLAGTLGDYDAEPRTKEGRVDVPLLLKQIEAAHLNTYDFLIWHAKTDWDDFQQFVSQAKAKKLNVWITLAPPSEPPPSAPFGLDYVRWADEVGKLSVRFDNIVGLVIDDFWSDENRALFTPSYIANVAQTLRRHNPRLAFLPTIYWSTIGDDRFAKDFGASIDGIVFPYEDLESTRDLPSQLSGCRKWLGPNKLVLVNVYASGSSGRGERGPRSAEYLRSVLEISRQSSDGIRIYCLPKQDLDKDYRFALAAGLFGKWRIEQAPRSLRP